MDTKEQEKKVIPCKTWIFILSLILWKFTGGTQNDVNTNSSYAYG